MYFWIITKIYLMKGIVIIAIFSIFHSVYSQTTATNFTVNDCAGVSHNLFSELDAGKIVVIAWVMPCGSCAPPSLAAYNAVQSYATSNPNTVLFYLVDDYANTSCSTLTSWGNTNSMPNATKFSNSAISMNDYGTAGMPKIVVLGGADHSIAYNLNSGVTTSGVQNAIDNLLSVASLTENHNLNEFKMMVTPNPVTTNFQIDYYLNNSSSIHVEIFSLTGELVFESKIENQDSGKHQLTIDENNKLENGMYILMLRSEGKSESINFIVSTN